MCADNTQDPVEDEQQLARVKEWINCCHVDTIDLTDVLSNFPDISMVPFSSPFLIIEHCYSDDAFS